tara:strand:+ start:3263 stop:3565 length:303 start_codon:yes stop_codon:yes gene_type:complete
MDVVKTIRPDQHGSHRFLDELGDRLVAGRLASIPTLNHRALNITDRNRVVAIRVRYEENELRQKSERGRGGMEPPAQSLVTALYRHGKNGIKISHRKRSR